MIGATLFSGIGAPEVAMPHWHWAWHAEIEKFPSAVMAARHPHSVNLGDVTAHDFCERAAAIARPDVLVFGSPCQSFSVAGKRLGLDDPRGNLALVALGIVDRLKPRWFVFENVPGLMSSGGGRDFGAFAGLVDELRYSLCWARLDAQHFGVAQRRERVFAVGHLGDWRYPAAVLLEPESLCGHHPPRRQAGERPAPTIASRPTGGGGLGTDFDCDGGLIASHANAGVPPAVAFQTSQSGFRQVDAHATLDANNGSRRHNGVAVGSTVRRLTPRECERLQGFPDDYTLIDYYPTGKRKLEEDFIKYLMRGGHLTREQCFKLAADGPRYKSLGNSMAVPVIRWILNRIEMFETQVRQVIFPPSPTPTPMIGEGDDLENHVAGDTA